MVRKTEKRLVCGIVKWYEKKSKTKLKTRKKKYDGGSGPLWRNLSTGRRKEGQSLKERIVCGAEGGRGNFGVRSREGGRKEKLVLKKALLMGSRTWQKYRKKNTTGRRREREGVKKWTTRGKS